MIPLIIAIILLAGCLLIGSFVLVFLIWLVTVASRPRKLPPPRASIDLLLQSPPEEDGQPGYQGRHRPS